MKKIGLFGGTFNPVHKGHLQVAEGAMKLFGLDKVYFIPTGESYHKDVGYMPEIQDRIKMLELAIDGNEKFLISRCDVDREGPTFTIDTLKDMMIIEPDATFYWIMGSDSLLNMLNWKNLNELIDSLYFLVAMRSGISRRAIRLFFEGAPEDLEKKVILFDWKIQNISSNEIKNNTYKKRHLPKKVYEYIKGKGLYNNAVK